MQFEVWARNRETKKYERLFTFEDEIQKYYKLDCVDRELYTEAMIVKTEWQKMPEAIMFQEFPKNKELYKGKGM